MVGRTDSVMPDLLRVVSVVEGRELAQNRGPAAFVPAGALGIWDAFVLEVDAERIRPAGTL
jgi:hypothetical protein